MRIVDPQSCDTTDKFYLCIRYCTHYSPLSFLLSPYPLTTPPTILCLHPTHPSSSTDRYANVDVGVLLYHIERFPGIIILTTNLIENIDKAFFRRLKFVLHFEIPSFNLRAKLWRVSALPTCRVTVEQSCLSKIIFKL